MLQKIYLSNYLFALSIHPRKIHLKKKLASQHFVIFIFFQQRVQFHVLTNKIRL